MVRAIAFCLVLLVAAGAARGGDAGAGGLDLGEPPRPGHEAPATAAEAGVIEFDWDGYRTLIVVGEGIGKLKPAWVATYESGQFIVGYRANAFRDARGRLHIDARRATDVGPMANNWIPDSFAFGDRVVWTLDDQGQGHTAAYDGMVPAARDREGWQRALQRVQALVEGGL